MCVGMWVCVGVRDTMVGGARRDVDRDGVSFVVLAVSDPVSVRVLLLVVHVEYHLSAYTPADTNGHIQILVCEHVHVFAL